MTRVEHRIDRTPEFLKAFDATMRGNGWSIDSLAREAGVSRSSVLKMRHSGHPSVSKNLGAKVIGAVARNPQEEFDLLRLAGIPVCYVRDPAAGLEGFFKML